MLIGKILVWQLLLQRILWSTVGFMPPVPNNRVHSDVRRSGGSDSDAGVDNRWDETHSVWVYREHIKQSELEKAKGAIYRQSVLNKDELSEIKGEIAVAASQLHEESASIAQNRLGVSLGENSKTVRILKEGSLCQLVRKVTDDDSMVLSSHLPVQVRSYEKLGASMAWHHDDVLYDPPQVEAVLTLENTSDCVTMWKEAEQLHSKETDSNSVLLLRAGGPLHCVTSLKRGRRIIIKCAYVSSAAKFREGLYKDQFRTATKKSGKSRN